MLMIAPAAFVGTDMLAAALPASERAELAMDFTEALVELFPDCTAVYFENSGKLFTAETIRNHTLPRDNRFIQFAVNVRFFTIQGGEDMLVDTLGMSLLSLPDLQYHFRGLDPNLMVNHAYNIALYLLINDNTIETGDTIGATIYFTTKAYKPETEDGRKTLAHELIHVQQMMLHCGERKINIHGMKKLIVKR